MKLRDDLYVSPKDKAIKAVKAGKKAEALKYIEELDLNFKPLHDRYVGWIEYLLDLIAQKLGEEEIEKAVREIGVQIYAPWLSNFKKATSAEIAGFYGSAHCVHHSDYHIYEFEDRYEVVATHCGSGGRLQKEAKVKTTSKPYPWSFNRKGVNYYCTHCDIHGKLFTELGLKRVVTEYGQMYDKKGKPTGELCKYIIYKGEPEEKA